MRPFVRGWKGQRNEQSADPCVVFHHVVGLSSGLPHTIDPEMEMIGSTLTAQALDVLWLLISGGIACMLVRGDKGIW